MGRAGLASPFSTPHSAGEHQPPPRPSPFPSSAACLSEELGGQARGTPCFGWFLGGQLLPWGPSPRGLSPSLPESRWVSCGGCISHWAVVPLGPQATISSEGRARQVGLATAPRGAQAPACSCLT